jgi:D-alanyl-D-alanine carboxypeptidase/D-alanyl-D-alanine-endopeptidase (penicillin-binding protein 4)
MRLVGLLVFASALGAQTLANRIDRILVSSPQARQATWGIHVLDLRTGVTVYSKNERQFFVPASNTKLFSTALALMRLGPDYRFRTTITAPEKPDATGRVAELRFVGGGSPNLSARSMPYEYDSPWADPLRHVEAFAQQLVDSGVRTVDGDIVADISAYTDQPYPDGWALDDPVYDYGAPVYSLFVNDAMFRVRVTPGTPPSIELTPPMPGLAIHNRIAVGSPTKLAYSRLPGSEELTISGLVDKVAEGDLGMENPPLYAGEALRDALLKRGVQVQGTVRVESFPSPGVPLVSHDSEPLTEALKVINKESVNLHAEIVLLEVARVRTATGTRKAALEEMAAFLQEIGIEKEQYHLRDGSGLSRHTLLTPATITKLLAHMYGSPHRDRWVDTLPIGGVDGTLAKRFKNDRRGQQIHAKTGSITHVNALSGYAGQRYAFSIMVNNSNQTAATVRGIMDEVAGALVGPRAPVRKATRRVPLSGRAVPAGSR